MAESQSGGEKASRFSVNATVALASIVAGLVFGLIGLSMVTVQKASTGDRIFGCVLIAFAAWFAYRGVTGGKVVVTHDGVTTRSFLRTRHYPADSLSGAEVRVGQTGPNGFGRQYLVLRRADGGQVAFKELNCRPVGDSEGETVVEQAAEAIQAALGTAHP
jgi:hypothetical protein